MWTPSVGPFGLDVGYEHTLQLSEKRVLGTGAVAIVPTVSVSWLALDWAVSEGEHVVWRHRVDRLALAWRVGESVEFSVGRPVVSWASTLMPTPADPVHGLRSGRSLA